MELQEAMERLSAKADQADIAWQRYLDACPQNVTSATAVAAGGARHWFAYAGASAKSSTWTEACAETGPFFALAQQVQTGMCVAEDAARRSMVYPGTVRDLRTRHRLDWTGWDSACR